MNFICDWTIKIRPIYETREFANLTTCFIIVDINSRIIVLTQKEKLNRKEIKKPESLSIIYILQNLNTIRHVKITRLRYIFVLLHGVCAQHEEGLDIPLKLCFEGTKYTRETLLRFPALFSSSFRRKAEVSGNFV